MDENESSHEHHKVKHSKPKEESITITKSQLWQIVSAVLAIALVASVFTGGFGMGGGSSSGTIKVANAPAAAADAGAGAGNPAPQAEISFDNVRIQGSEDADVIIVEWSDFQCPYCSRFFAQTKGQLDSEYIETGEVAFVYKDFPLESIHPQATPAALASWCAAEQDAFWEYHDILFTNQQALSDSNYKQWAVDLGLDADQFNDCYDSGKYANNVQAELAEGSANGIRGTPGFIVMSADGEKRELVSGAQPFAAFQAAIERVKA